MRWVFQVLEDIMKRGKRWQKFDKESLYEDKR
jgi:hypothetical protein